MIEVLQAYGRPVVCAFEATGNYHRPIAWRLAEAGFEVRLVASLALARTREALHNSWDKNDPKDAQVMLHMLRIQATQVYHDPPRAGITTCRNCRRPMKRSPRAKTEIQHRILTHYLPLYFPEIDRFRGNSRSDWFFAFLHAFPTPASITDKGGVCDSSVGCRRPQGQQDTDSNGYLRDGALIDRTAAAA